MDGGKHPAGCFFGGPDGESFWFAVQTCPLEHDGGDTPPLWATPAGAAAAWEHLQAAGLTRTGESG
jgi:hypothetical protein